MNLPDFENVKVPPYSPKIRKEMVAFGFPLCRAKEHCTSCRRQFAYQSEMKRYRDEINRLKTTMKV